MPVGDIHRVVFYFRLAEQVAINVWHFRLSGIVGAELTNQQRADQWHATEGLFYVPLISNNVTVHTASVRHLFPLPQGLEVFSNQAAFGGGTGGTNMSKQTAGIVTLNTALPGRANRGRKYLPFPGELNNVDPGIPDPGYIASLTAWLNNFVPTTTLIVGGQNETWTPIIFRKTLPASSPTILTGKVRGVWATQRRRGSYGRPNVLPI